MVVQSTKTYASDGMMHSRCQDAGHKRDNRYNAMGARGEKPEELHRLGNLRFPTDGQTDPCGRSSNHCE